jgi:hypothetical protein
MKISYAVTVCNEINEIQELIPHLLEFKRSQDEVVVLYDNNGTKEVFDYLQSVEGIKLVWDNFDGHFANWKNKLNLLCSGDYIFQLDADELVSHAFIDVLPELLEENSECDLFWVPRKNIVKGLTQAHIDKWGWNVNEEGLVNWPDPQSRIYRNSESIHWENKVHEKIVGIKTVAVLPAEFNILHVKDIERQERQNDYYNTLI